MTDPQDLENLSWEKLVDGWDNANHKEEQAKAEAVILKEEMLARLKKEKIDARVVDIFTVSRAKKVTFGDTPFEFAEEHGALKKEKDQAKLKALHEKGVKVPGVKETEYVQIRRLEREEEVIEG